MERAGPVHRLGGRGPEPQGRGRSCSRRSAAAGPGGAARRRSHLGPEEGVPDRRAGRVVLVSAHGNSGRALVKHLDGISEEEIAELNLPTGVPLIYELDADMRPLRRGGEYLDPEAAALSIAAVKNQGR